MSKKLGYIVYNKRSCVTGKALFDSLKEAIPEISMRRACRNPTKRTPDFMIRWGNSSSEYSGIELNTADAVHSASDKGEMMNKLSGIKGITIPKIVDPENCSEVYDESGRAFFRNEFDQIRYRSNPITGDKYALRPIPKIREFRIHVFDNKTIGVYEKLPDNSSVMIYKNETCSFRRIDMGNEENREQLKGVRPMARKAVNELGLLFGGVDIIMDQNNEIYLLEVNSAPSLNSINIERWTCEFKKYIEDNV